MELLQRCRAEFSPLWLFFCFLTLMGSLTNAMHRNNETDKDSLLAFKAKLLSSATHNILSSWNFSSHFCEWEGVTCGRRHRRVTALDLHKIGLTGNISPHIGNLSFLRRIHLQENKLQGYLPQELGYLTRLQVLNISYNSLQGMIPVNLSHCSKLRSINLGNNVLVGEFPVELTTLPNLKVLWFAWNNLSGAILPSLSNLSSLEDLYLGGNRLIGGIPFELGRLQRLKALALESNLLSGTIPSSIYNLSSLTILSLSLNQLQGRLPPDLGLLLPNLEQLLLSGNQFTGPLPVTLSNASKLVTISFVDNHLSGKIPNNIGELQGLKTLELSYNQFVEDDNDLNILVSLTNCTKLNHLGLYDNQLTAYLPESISNLTRLTRLGLGRNKIFGKIPTGIGNLMAMERLVLESNSLTGDIPPSIWTLSRLHILGLGGNKLSGKIPSSFCNNNSLIDLSFMENNLEGNLPSTIGRCDKLQILRLYDNRFSGAIPKEVFMIPSLSIYLDFSFNFFSGPLPSEIGNMRMLETLLANNNNFSGEIPSSLGSCESLRGLDLSNNALQGIIPSSLYGLRAIDALDLSYNNLSGPIPTYLENFTDLHFLDLSFNNFEGEVPKGGVFLNSSEISLSGNNRICGGPPNLHLLACPKKMERKRRRSTHLPIVISSICIFIVALVIASIMVIYWKRRSTKQRFSFEDRLEGKYWKVSYQDILKATNGFSSEHLIGSGRNGSVYKATFEQASAVVAVKVFNLQVRGSSKTFAIECKALRKIRHRNLVKIITSCASVDHQGNDFKALIFQYMSNGSLQEWLHNNSEGDGQKKYMNVVRRLNIAIDVATALEYLHNHCDKPIVHCDIKPSNILLDDEMIAHLADFGLAKIQQELSSNFSHDKSSSALVKGTIGYVPPEYGLGGEVSMKGDVYSYGILLLELFTGKGPTNDMFINGQNLHAYVEAAIPNKILEILDEQLLLEIGASGHEATINCLASVLHVGLSCSMTSPRERPEIKDVLKEICDIQDAFLRGGSEF